MRFPNLRRWTSFGTGADAEAQLDLEEMGTAFGLDESLSGDDAAQPAPAADDEPPYAWLARRGVRAPQQ